MTQKKQKGIPPPDNHANAPLIFKNLSEKDVSHISKCKLDLYLELDKQRSLHFDSLIKSLHCKFSEPFLLQNWVRLVDYQFSDSPLSCHGSISSFGGRFNIGRLENHAFLSPFYAFYCAENYETAFREKFGIDSHNKICGLSLEELALCNKSHSTVFLQGKIHSFIDITEESNLEKYVEIIKTFQLPTDLVEQANELGISSGIIHSVDELLQLLLEENWRIHPSLFDVPAQCQLFGEIVHLSGYEGIIYRSTKSNSKCLCLFPQKMNPTSYIALKDSYPQHVCHPRLDIHTSKYLAE